MKDYKKITILYKHINYSLANKGLGRLRKSILHSLRRLPEEDNLLKSKVIEWDSSRSQKNLFWVPGMNSLKKLSELTKDEKDKICSSILSAIKAESFSKTVEANTAKELSKYKAKLKKWCESESDAEVASLLRSTIEASNEPDPDWVLKKLSNIEFKRKAQKTDTLRKYFSLKIQRKSSTSNLHLNKTII